MGYSMSRQKILIHRQAFQELCGSSSCHTWEMFSVPADHTYDLSFAVCRGLPPLMAYFQVAGALDSSIVFWVGNIQIVRCPRAAPPTCGIALVLSCCLINLWQREESFNKRKHTQSSGGLWDALDSLSAEAAAPQMCKNYLEAFILWLKLFMDVATNADVFIYCLVNEHDRCC